MQVPALAFLVMVLAVKEMGIPIPVPGDLLVIGAGAAAARGGLSPVVIVIALVAATVAGGAIQFWLLRGRARAAMFRLMARVGLGESMVERRTVRFRGAGSTGVAIARMTPGVRVLAIASSALAEVPGRSFLVGLLVGNAVFVTGHFLLGLLVGEPAVGLVAAAGPALVIGGLTLAILGLVGWAVVSRTRRRPSGGQTGLAWVDACCPACLALAFAAPDRASGSAS
jgi:membrane-associated protein